MKALLNQRWAANPPQLAVGQKKLVVYDTRVAGFHAEVRPTTVTYYLKWKDARGESKTLKIGRSADLTADQARKKASELRSKIALGGDPHEEKKQAKEAVTVAEYVAERFLPHQKARKKSWREDEKILRKRILPSWGRRRLADVTTEDVQRLHDSIISDGRKPATANRHLALVKRMFSLAVVWGDVARDPAKPVRLHRENNQRHRYLDGSEIAALVAALDADHDKVGVGAVKLLLLTGCRAGEVLGAKWEDVDFNRRLLALPDPKGGRRAHKPLSDAAVSLLLAQPKLAGNPFVFPGDRVGDHRHELRNTWARACQAAGISDCRLHDLRHTFASVLVQSGTSLFVVQRLLNHSSPAMTQRYAHLAPTNLLDACNAVGCAVIGDDVTRLAQKAAGAL